MLLADRRMTSRIKDTYLSSAVSYAEKKENTGLSKYNKAAGRLIKRAVDLVLSLAALLVLGVPMLLIALFIKLDSPGPAVFRQVRLGTRGRPFVCYKFRTMQADNDDGAHKAYVKALITADQAHGDDRQFKIKNDARITRMGRFLRMTSFDELMQIFNVIKGEMSLVGPRPPLAYEAELYDRVQRRRLLVKPGITGLWQVRGRSSVGFREMVAFDLKYIESWSIWLDLAIILRTIPALVRYRGW